MRVNLDLVQQESFYFDKSVIHDENKVLSLNVLGTIG